MARKNIRPLAGEPLIGYTLRTAARASEIDLLVVSTEDPKIAKVSREYQVRVIDRPVELATDSAATEPVLLHALDQLEGEGFDFDIVVVLEPTSPLRSVITIERAIRLCGDGMADSVLAVRETRENLGHVENGFFRPLNPDAPRRRQLREPLFAESSTIYATRTRYLRRTGTLVCEDWGALVVPPEEAVDINSELDFLYVGSLIQRRKEQRS